MLAVTCMTGFPALGAFPKRYIVFTWYFFKFCHFHYLLSIMCAIYGFQNLIAVVCHFMQFVSLSSPVRKISLFVITGFKIVNWLDNLIDFYRITDGIHNLTNSPIGKWSFIKSISSNGG